MEDLCARCDIDLDRLHFVSRCCLEHLCTFCWDEMELATRLRGSTQAAVVADVKKTGRLSDATLKMVRLDAEGRCDCGAVLKDISDFESDESSSE